MPRLLGVDLGGTNVKLGICDERGRVFDSHSIRTGASRGPEAVVADIAAAARRLRGFDKVTGCGIGAPGPLDAGRTTILTAPNLGWRNVPLPRILQRAMGKRVVMENDANCAALGEYVAGCGAGSQCFALYTLGTGIGGGLIMNGKLWIGSSGGAAEFGHVVIDPRGPACGCGRRGCLEAHASATAVARMAGTVDAQAAFDQAKRGNRKAKMAVNRAAAALGLGIGGIFNILQPDRFALSGGMAAAGIGFLATVRKAANDAIFPEYRDRLSIVTGTLGTRAGWIGAALVQGRRAS